MNSNSFIGVDPMASIEQLQKINTSVHQVYLALTTKEGLSEVWTGI